jgi:asparagine synthetase B (glutamine-hydrolysing)
MRDDGIDLVLSGDGGDEAVGDSGAPDRAPLVRFARGAARRVLAPARRAATRRRALVGLPPGLAASARGIDEPERTPRARPGLHGGAAARDRALRSARQAAMADWNRGMAGLFGARASSPFLDPRVVDAVTSLPEAAFETDRAPKALLRRALEGRLPAALATRAKDQPPGEPTWSRAAREHGESWLERFVEGGALEAAGLLGLADARELLRAAGEGDAVAIPRALALLGLSSWVRARAIPV